ncbi:MULTISPECIES: DUF411 domain-containing protein [unclassified Bradyrhizobium]|nr:MULTISPECIES: DUF411 domain-containing protein [unclassified Bradyrhizobium]
MAVAPPPLRAATDVLVYKDPNCDCCGDWVKQVGDAGFSVQIEEASDLSAIRSRLGVPPDLAGCHTAEVGGYVIEGHVPVAAVSRLLSERPDAVGISAPGMPQGSPGMSGSPKSTRSYCSDRVVAGPSCSSSARKRQADKHEMGKRIPANSEFTGPQNVCQNSEHEPGVRRIERGLKID